LNRASPIIDEARFLCIRLKIIPSAPQVAAQSQQSWLRRRLSSCDPCRRRRQERRRRNVHWELFMAYFEEDCSQNCERSKNLSIFAAPNDKT